MRKRKLDKIAGHNLWDLEVENWINHCGLHPDDARMWTILRWMYSLSKPSNGHVRDVEAPRDLRQRLTSCAPT